MNNEIASYTISNADLSLLLSATIDAAYATPVNIWVDRSPTKADALVFWSPEFRSKEALVPNDKVWDEIDAMLAVVWASEQTTSVEEEAEIDAELMEIMHMSELIRFESLYGEPDSWE